MNRIFQLSRAYLRKYLQLCCAPAFEPYFWFLAEYYGPQQCTLLILVYLIHHRGTDDEQIARYYVDDYLDFMAKRSDKKPQTQMAVNVIIGLCGQVDTQMFYREDSPTEDEHRKSLSEFQATYLWDSIVNDMGFNLPGADLDL